jgi:hypothetical protein
VANVLVIDGRPTRPGSDWTTAGLPHAAGYYRTFPHEPSPLGDIDFAASDIHPLTANVSLGSVLAQLTLAGSGGIAVLICHAWNNSNGLLIPVAPGGTSKNLSPSAMTGIDQAIQAEKDVAAIGKMPQNTAADTQAVIAAWTKLIDALQPGAISGTFQVSDAQTWYNKWIQNLATQLEFSSSAALRQLLTAVQTMRTTHIARLELRACQIGSDTATMEQLRNFFGADQITAPVFATFFGVVPVATLVTVRRPRGNLGPSQAQAAAGALERAEDDRVEQLLTETDTTRGFVKERLERYTNQANITGFFPIGILGWFKLVSEFVLRIRETTPYVVETHAWVTSQGAHHDPDLGLVNKFVQAMILPGSGFRDRNLPIAGFFTPTGKGDWQPDRQSLPWVLPNEPEYKSSIKKSP